MSASLCPAVAQQNLYSINFGQGFYKQPFDYPLKGSFDYPYKGPLFDKPPFFDKPPIDRPPVDGPGKGDGGGGFNQHNIRDVPPPFMPPPLHNSGPPVRFPAATPPTNSVFVPTDVTTSGASQDGVVELSRGDNFTGALAAFNGVEPLRISDFPKDDDAKGNSEWILVRARAQTKYDRPTAYEVTLQTGGILVSVKRPSHLAFVKTNLGKVAISANGDAIINYVDGKLRVINLDGVGKSVRVKLTEGPFAGKDSKVVALRPGYELVAGDKELKRLDLRPHDGITRRKASIVMRGFAAVNELSLHSVIASSDLVVDVAQKAKGVQERRILSDMSKMAAVLDYLHNNHEFVHSTKLAQGGKTN
ncbi:MAG TPA: hypothetical protein V6D17_17920 [Candidatus Obscuribacterales bacterium]